MFSVDTEDEAKRLLSLACDTNLKGEFIARELVEEQTFERLKSFSDRLSRVWKVMNTGPHGSVESLTRRACSECGEVTGADHKCPDEECRQIEP